MSALDFEILSTDGQARTGSLLPAPGAIDTPMTERLRNNPQTREETIRGIPIGRIGTTVDIAYGVLFLASDESSFVTGSELVIDGGTTAQ